jgi:hypothetical protein
MHRADIAAFGEAFPEQIPVRAGTQIVTCGGRGRRGIIPICDSCCPLTKK